MRGNVIEFEIRLGQTWKERLNQYTWQIRRYIAFAVCGMFLQRLGNLAVDHKAWDTDDTG